MSLKSTSASWRTQVSFLRTHLHSADQLLPLWTGLPQFLLPNVGLQLHQQSILGNQLCLGRTGGERHEAVFGTTRGETLMVPWVQGAEGGVQINGSYLS